MGYTCRRVMKEQSDILGGDLSKDLEFADVEQLTEFDMVFSEVLRLHPPFFQLARVVMEDVRYAAAPPRQPPACSWCAACCRIVCMCAPPCLRRGQAKYTPRAPALCARGDAATAAVAPDAVRMEGGRGRERERTREDGDGRGDGERVGNSRVGNSSYLRAAAAVGAGMVHAAQ